MKEKNHEVIVVGAGPSGSTAAYLLAKNGISTLLLERGAYPGSKNVFGGNIYSKPTAEIIPGFWKEAPIERPVTREELWLMEEESCIKMGFTGLRFSKPPYNKLIVKRSEIDSWLAEKAEQEGALLQCNTLVKKLSQEKNKTGVITSRGEVIPAEAVILAEGVNSLLTYQNRMRKELAADKMTLYVKEVLELPAVTIEERFQLDKDQGAIIGIIGYPTAGAPGRGGIWTNRDTISLIVGSYLDQIVDKGLNPFHLLQRTKKHPLISPLLAGSRLLEYQAHLIPKGGYYSLPRLYRDGILVVGDAAMMISGRRGTDLAMLSGKIAAETIIQARARGSYTAQNLALYQQKISDSFFFKDIKAKRGFPQYRKKHPDADLLISKTANTVAHNLFEVDLKTEKSKEQQIIKTLSNLQPPIKSINDLVSGLKHWEAF